MRRKDHLFVVGLVVDLETINFFKELLSETGTLVYYSTGERKSMVFEGETTF